MAKIQQLIAGGIVVFTYFIRGFHLRVLIEIIRSNYKKKNLCGGAEVFTELTKT